ncbi:unnamed protein product [Rhodiola kirilowii]
MDNRLTAMEEKRIADMHVMEEKRAADMHQVMAAFERLTKTVEDNKPAHDPTGHRHGKQPMLANLEPPLLDTPPATVGHSTISDPSGEPPLHTTNEPTPKQLRTPRMEVPIFHGEGVVGWLFQINRYFKLNNTPHDEMLEAVPLFLAGDALLWFQWKATTCQISTWERLAQDLKRRFGPSDYYDAEVAINQLVQTTSVHAYITEFVKPSASAPRLLGHNLLKRFIAGLKPDIHHELVMLKPPELEIAMDMARVAEDKVQSLRRLTSR